MDISELLQISKTHILSKIKQSGIAALGVTFGIATFIILVSFMTGLNGLLDSLILDRTPHIHLFNEVKPSENQPLDLLEKSSRSWNLVSSIKPKQKRLRIHNALPIMQALNNDPKILGVTAQVGSQTFYTAGTLELNGMINGVDILKEVA